MARSGLRVDGFNTFFYPHGGPRGPQKGSPEGSPDPLEVKNIGFIVVKPTIPVWVSKVVAGTRTAIVGFTTIKPILWTPQGPPGPPGTFIVDPRVNSN